MGASFSCMGGYCNQDGTAEFSAEFSPAGKETTHISSPLLLLQLESLSPTKLYSTLPSDGDELGQDCSPRISGHISTPDSGSQESVMSAISPTKERAPSPHRPAPPSLNALYLSNIHTEKEILDSWSELKRCIQDGDLGRLQEHVNANKLQLPNLRFKEDRRSMLHMAVQAGQAHVVQHFLDEGVSINLKDQDGVTAMGLAYQINASSEILQILNKAKALEFAASPYSPYALSVASAALSVHSRRDDTPLALETTPAPPHSTGPRSKVCVQSPASAEWTTPRSRAFSQDNLQEARRTVNSPASSSLGDQTPHLSFLQSPRRPMQGATSDSVKRRMELVGESLGAIKERQRAFSLPANSPTFDGARARSPTDPPLMILPISYSADNTPLEGSSPRSTLSTGEVPATRPPLGKATARLPLGKRLRKAAGRAIAMIVPHRGLPPKVPVLPARAAASTPPAVAADSNSPGTTQESTEDAERFSVNNPQEDGSESKSPDAKELKETLNSMHDQTVGMTLGIAESYPAMKG